MVRMWSFGGALSLVMAAYLALNGIPFAGYLSLLVISMLQFYMAYTSSILLNLQNELDGAQSKTRVSETCKENK